MCVGMWGVCVVCEDIGMWGGVESVCVGMWGGVCGV